jgi:acetyl-CoA carboxylase carboxyltransferase component
MHKMKRNKGRLEYYSEKKKLLGHLDYSKQHAKGRLSAPERINLLFDPGTFVEIDALAQQDHYTRGIKPQPTPRDGIMVGYGKVKGRTVAAAAYDITMKGGSMGFVREWKMTRLKRMVAEQGIHFVLLNDGSGVRLEEEISS